MASLFHFSPIISSLFLITSCYALNQTPKPYIVYMGSPLNNSGDSAEIAELSHLRMLSSIIPSEESERISVRHSYHHAYRGFCALLTEDEATLLSGHEEVVSVFPDPVLQLHTTRSWNFLGLGSSYYSRSSSYRYNHGSSYDIIIGVIDTGIWPESPSFDDQHIGKVPSRWKGVCMEGFDFDKSNCNRKLIGARFYKIEDQESSFTKIPNITTKPSKPNGTPRDKVGHGTNTASIAAGAIVPNANYYGLANGTARGGLPSARIATYKACSEGNCQGSAILKAIDDAIKDGVDIISISIGRSFVFQTDFKDDPIAIGALHAAEKGVMVVCSGGNEGPDPYTVTNSAPWIFTVAASTIDRKFQSTIVLGNNVSLKGSGISYNPTGRSRSRTYPLAFGENIPFHPSLTSQARNCMPGSLDAKRVTGKIIVCMNDDWTISREIKKLVVQDAKAKGLILIDEAEKSSPFDSGNFPFTEVGKLAGAQILQYINSSQNPLATIFPANEIRRFKPAPVVADFSSRGPATLTENILKPDISAPGVGILSAMIPIVDEVSSNLLPEKKSSSLFGITSGTSMACPHVTGAMAFIKSIHPTWSFSMIKSAIMTTATISNNLRKHLTNTSAQACASRVIAVEASEKMAAVAAQIAKDNNILRTGSENEGSDPSNGVMEVVQGMVEELQSTQKVQPHSVDVLVSEWMGYCLLYESMLSSVLYARDQFLKPGGAVLPDMATMFVAGFGRGGTSIPFWENVYGFNMSCIGEEIVKDASRIPIVDVIDSCDIITNSTVLQNFDLVTMKLEEMDFTAKVELELKGETSANGSTGSKPNTTWCYGVVIWFDTGFTERFCKEKPTILSTSPHTPSTHWSQTILTFSEPIAMVSSRKLNVDKMAAVGTEACPAVKIQCRISVVRAAQHRSIDISMELSGIGSCGRKRNWPAQMFNL
ncbi:CO(2)-response secreted protease-like [Nicotiana tabacum]|uniref:CO(2)-response secreted protease-like n=1 Tax=Nicotiana tabacum TaxID=4097 RepID=A0AC58RME9_TOBAC